MRERPRAIFLDNQGVLSETSVLPAQWARLLGEFLARELGGDPGAWAAANQPVAKTHFRRYRDAMLASDEVGDFFVRGDREWLRDLCAAVGVRTPADAAADDLVVRTIAYVTTRTRSARPGAADAVRALHAAGYALHTASSDRSVNLDGYLRGMRVRHLFGRCYGPDLVGRWKKDRRFYEAVCADAGVAPRDALVVDDDAERLDWARDAGAATIRVAADGPASAHRTVASLAELPRLLVR